MWRKIDETVWKGREVLADLPIQYWYQAVRSTSLADIMGVDSKVGIIGYECDEGVRRNKGRVGARLGPQIIRQQLAKLAFHHGQLPVVDFGNIVCENSQLEKAQEELSQLVSKLRSRSINTILLGGGHDIAYAHAKGILDGSSKCLGIINFDAHFDLRPVHEHANSGTPFNQLLHEFPQRISYFPIGIQPTANTPQLYEIAKVKGIDFVELEACNEASRPHWKSKLDKLLNEVDEVYITIDLDGFNEAVSPGVSATSPIGLEVSFVMKTLATIFKSGKVVACDIAEYNPKVDRDHITAKLAAILVDYLAGLYNGS